MTMTESPVVPRTVGGPSWDWILETGAVRQDNKSVLIDEMRDIKDRYNGDIVYPWADKLANDDVDALTPHLIGESIDAYGMRAASVPMDIICPPLYMGAQKGRGSREWADKRRQALAATFHRNRFPLISRKFYRHLTGYSTTTLIVTPDFKANMPRIQVINPLNSFPDPQSADNFHNPEDLITINGYSAAHLRAQFPAVRLENGGPIDSRERSNELWDVLTYMDSDVIVVGLAGRRTDWAAPYTGNARVNSRSMELSRIENRAHMVTGISMGRVTLDRLTTAMKHVTGQVDWAAKLQLLEIEAAEKSIYPDLYMMSDGARAPKIHSGGGKWQDGRSGAINVLSDVQQIGQMRSTPDPAGNQAIDRLERNSRVSLGLAAQWGGETSNALRTGRGIETMLSASTDPRLAEMHEIALAWMPVVGQAVLECWKGYWPDTKQVMYSGYSSGHGSVEFEPSKHFSDSTEVAFSYPIAGGDIQLTNIVLLQQLGAEAISKSTFRRKHPWIDDPEAEEKRVKEEQLEQLAFQALTQQAMGGEIPLEQLAMIEAEYRNKENADIFTAIRNAAEKLKQMQAEEVPETPEELVAPPEMMPGIGGPTAPGGAGMPMAAPEGGGIGPPSGIEGLRELQNALAAGGRRVNGVIGPQ